MDISVLVYVLLIIAFAKAMGELVSRINQPAIVGELLAGMILGPFVLGNFIGELQSMYADEFIKGLADLGILLLMLYIGLEFSPKRILSSSWAGVLIAIGGMILPIFLGLLVGVVFNLGDMTTIFLAIAISVTALPVTIRILKDMEVLETETSSKIISAAMITDITLLFAMGVVISGQNGTQSIEGMLLLAAGFILFFVLAFLLSRYVIPQMYRLLRWMQTGEAAFAIAIGFAIAFAVIASLVGLPAFIGAFIAGMMLRETGTGLKVWSRVEEILSGITMGFLAPIFFVMIGFSVDFRALLTSSSSIILLFIAILFVAIFGKFIGTVIPAKILGIKKNESLAIGFMMMGKGAMELVFAQIALEIGLIGPDLFSALILMAFISTAIAPVMFKHYFNKGVLLKEIARTSKKEELPIDLQHGI